MSGFDTYGVCECGYHERIPFGDTRHIHKSVCPGCGASVHTWETVVGRVENVGSFWRPLYRVVPREDAVKSSE